MNIMYYFRHIDSSEALKNDVDQRVAALEPLINKTLPIHVRFSVENSNQFTVHVELHARNNNHVYVEESSDDMYKSVDAAFQDLKRVLTREKEKQVDHHIKADPFLATALAAAAVTYEIEEADAIDAEDVIHEHQATGH